MMRLLGIMMITAASTAMGLAYIRIDAEHIKALRSMLQLLKDVRGELDARLTPLPELFFALKSRSTGAAADFAALLSAGFLYLGQQDFFQLWTRSVKKSLSMLAAEEQEAIVELGRSLGRYELERQLAELDGCISRLEGSLARCSAALPEKRRLGMGLAWACGAMLLIVLI